MGKHVESSKKISLKPSAASHNSVSWYTDIDASLEHSLSGRSLYYKGPTLQKIILVFGAPSLLCGSWVSNMVSGIQISPHVKIIFRPLVDWGLSYTVGAFLCQASDQLFFRQVYPNHICVEWPYTYFLLNYLRVVWWHWISLSLNTLVYIP